jgi:hypothetical protein
MRLVFNTEILRRAVSTEMPLTGFSLYYGCNRCLSLSFSAGQIPKPLR